MKRIQAIIRPEKLEELKDVLKASEISGITISQVMGCGQQMGWKEFYRGSELLINILPKVQIEMVVEDSKAEEAVKLITEIARTGEIGDGKIFISDVAECIRIRTGERGEKAL